MKELASRAAAVLRRNDMGGWTKAAPNLYPHQWSWDSAFIAIGLAQLDPARAARELVSLFEHQWATGKVPHIVFNPKAPPESYFPGPEHWAAAAPESPDAPPMPAPTSGLCQPPVHAIAALRIWEVALERGGKCSRGPGLSCTTSARSSSPGTGILRPSGTPRALASSPSITRGRAGRTTLRVGTAPWRRSK